MLWASMMWGCKFLHALGLGVIVSLQCVLNTDRQNLYSPSLNIAYLFLIRTFAYVVDFLIVMTLLYLFYCQGRTAERKRLQSNKSAQQLFHKELGLSKVKHTTSGINDQSLLDQTK